MDYKFETTAEVFNSLLVKEPQKNLTFKVFEYTNFSHSQNFSNFAFFLACCEKVLTMKHFGIQRVLQFFILSAYKNFKYKNPNHDGEINALEYAIDNIISENSLSSSKLTSEQKVLIIETVKNTEYKKESLVNFYKKLEVLSDWATESYPIKIHESLFNDTKNSLEESINNFIKQNMIPEALKEKLLPMSMSFSLTNPFQKKPQKSLLDETLNGMSYKDYCLSFMSDENLTKKDKYKKMIDFFSLLMTEKTEEFKLEKELISIIEYHFDDRFKFRSIEIAHDTEKLVEEYIPKLIDFVSLLGDGDHKKEINDSIGMLTSYSKKINDYYIDEIKREMNIFKTFLEAKTNNLNT